MSAAPHSCRAWPVVLRGWILALLLLLCPFRERTAAAETEKSKADHWAFKPTVRPSIPAIKNQSWARNPIDNFVLSKLEALKLAPSREAGRVALIRRLSFDLTGLPPGPEEVRQFASDTRPDAYEKLVDRLLGSPRYGERWARHWLDVVHYGDSHGYDKDKPRPNAWPYRDYIIRSFNSDTPYSRFAQEQIAGDALFPGTADGVVALGFIAAGPWDYVGHVELPETKTDGLIARYNDRDDMVMNTMSTFLSLTVHCARCHDHKFDPISQEEYYSLQAVFAGVDRADRPFDSDPKVAARRRRLMAEKNKEIDALPGPQIVYAAATDFATTGSFVAPRAPRLIHLLKRGDIKSPGPVVSPGALNCVPGLSGKLEIGDPNDEGSRRAALAKWITDRRNLLARRSIVNRVWQYHFGRGIVDTPNDFGRMGSQPTHPELLDWLACWFLDNGESLKKLHRLMVTSATYRQSSQNDPAFARIDGDNRFLWRMNRQRLDAESFRDTLLLLSGKLDLTAGGPSVRQFFFKDDHSPTYDYTRFDADSPAACRRSVYRFIVRSVPDPFMEALDCSDANMLTPKRNITLTALQALSTLNDPFVLRQCEHFAERLKAAGSTANDQVQMAFRLTLNREPTTGELRLMSNYARKHGLANACRVLLNSSEFFFVD